MQPIGLPSKIFAIGQTRRRISARFRSIDYGGLRVIWKISKQCWFGPKKWSSDMTNDRRLRVNFADDERQIITAQAGLLGMSANGYIRMKVFAPGTDTSIHLTDRMQATSAIGLSLNSARRLEAQLKPLIQDQAMLIAIQAELEQLQVHLAAAQAHLFQPNSYAG
jgi:hypothetical protein